MRFIHRVVAIAAVPCVTGCSVDASLAPDEPVDATIAVTSTTDTENVLAGGDVELDIHVGGDVVLVPPDQEPLAADLDKAVYVEVLLDGSRSLVTTAQAHVELTIPSDTKEGIHELACVVKAHDDGAVSATSSIAITVKGAASAP